MAFDGGAVAMDSPLPGWLSDALGWVGLRWPQGDSTELSAAGDVWLAFARTVREHRTSADAAARLVWDANSSEMVDAFRGWWNANGGPSTNLAQAASAAELIGTALKGLATQVAILKAVFIAQLTALVMMLVGAGLAVVASGGTSLLGGAAAIEMARRAMIRAVEAAIAVVAAALIGQMLLRAAESLAPAAVRDRRPSPQIAPDPKPGKGPGPLPVPFWPSRPEWSQTSRPRCKVLPEMLIPTRPWLVGDPDPRTAGGAILRIEATKDPDGRRIVAIDGIIQDPIERQGFEKSKPNWSEVQQSIGMPSGLYDASHLYGPRFGSEAAAGIYLAPASEMNRGFQWVAEQHLQDLRTAAEADGGWVELHAVATTHRPEDFGNTGALFLANADYEATVCRSGQVLSTERFGLAVGLPVRAADGSVTPGRVTTYLP